MSHHHDTSGVRAVGGVRVLNVASTAWEGFEPTDDSHAGEIQFRQDGEGERELSAMQWLRPRAASTGGVPMATGLYRMEPSTFDFTFPGDETIYMVSGSIDVELEGGERVELRAGDLAYFPEGLRTTWHVLETTLEFFTLLG